MVKKLLNSYATHIETCRAYEKEKSNIATKGNINDNTTFSLVSSNEVQKRFKQLNPRCNNTSILTLSVIIEFLLL